jgi:hypothetical protein
MECPADSVLAAERRPSRAITRLIGLLRISGGLLPRQN